MSPVHCALCGHRVSDWEMASNKTREVNGKLVHKTCLIDYKLRHGVEYGTWRRDWSVGLYET